MMEEFLEKWKKDQRYRTKVKLIAYTLFVVVVSIYALSINGKRSIEDYTLEEEPKVSTDIIKIPEKSNYTIDINIDDNNYKYYVAQNEEKKYITKEINGEKKEYIYENNEYYVMSNINIDDYIITTREEVYDVVDYNYINIDTINKYLTKATKENNINKIYIKDIILGNDSENYFTIEINKNIINIDYTKLMQIFKDKNINKYLVNIEIEEKE